MSNVLEMKAPARSPWALSGALLEFAAEGEFALVHQIVGVFLADTQKKIESLQKTVRSGDLSEARRIAHSLKGSARQVGTIRLADESDRLEQCSKEVDQATFSLLALAVVLSWEDARRSIIGELESMPGKV
jgi:HPt (histidine-containing phosphotransfer) domain-containing protein